LSPSFTPPFSPLRPQPFKKVKKTVYKPFTFSFFNFSVLHRRFASYKLSPQQNP